MAAPHDMAPFDRVYTVRGAMSVYRRLRDRPADWYVGGHYLNNLPQENPGKVFQAYCGFLVASGRGSYRDWSGTLWELRPGSFAQHLPGKYHVVRRDPGVPWAEYSVSLGIPVYERIAALGGIDPERAVVNVGLSAKLVDQFRSVINALRNAAPTEVTMAMVKIQELLVQLKEVGRDGQNEETSAAALVREACELLSVNLGERVRLPEAAARFNVSYPHFRRLFRQHTGMAPGAYRIQCRVDQAKVLLSEKRWPLKRIADALGYADVFVFSKQFRKFTGFNPSEFQIPATEPRGW